jgi:hypothetical protein
MNSPQLNAQQADFALTLQKVNAFLAENQWYDFDIWDTEGHSLTIVGSLDLTLSHTLSIKFNDIFYYQLPASWRTNPTKNVFSLPDTEEQAPINRAYEIEQGYQMIKIVNEYDIPMYISCKSIDVSYEEKIIFILPPSRK